MLEQQHQLIYHTAEQGSAAWHEARQGRVTGTSAAPLLTKPGKGSRGGLSAGCWTLIYRLASEIAFPDPPDADPFVSKEMDRGSRNEPLARKDYELANFEPVREVGFIEVKGRLAGFSADGIIDQAKGLEIKNLRKDHHMRWLEEGKVPTAHRAQIEWAFFCAGFQSWDLLHYHPRFGSQRGRQHVLTFTPDPKTQARFAEAFPLLEAEVHRLVAKYATDQAPAPVI